MLESVLAAVVEAVELTLPMLRTPEVTLFFIGMELGLLPVDLWDTHLSIRLRPDITFPELAAGAQVAISLVMRDKVLTAHSTVQVEMAIGQS